MGNCCCLLRDKNKINSNSIQKRPIENLNQNQQHKKTKLKHKKSKKNYYKYGDDDEYDNDDYLDDNLIDYDTKTTKSDLSTNQNLKSNRLLNKALLNNQHHHQNKQQINNQQSNCSSSSSSTILLLQQSHLINQNKIENKLLLNLNLNLNNSVNLNHNNSYKYAIKNNSENNRWSLNSSRLILGNRDNEKCNLLLNEEDLNEDEGIEDDHIIANIDIEDLNLNKNLNFNQEHLANEKSKEIETPKFLKSINSKSSSIEELTSNSAGTDNLNSLNEDLNKETIESQRNNDDQVIKRLAYRKRSSNLNQSLNETDLVINSNKKSNSNCKRKLKQRKIDLDQNESVNNTQDFYDEDEEYNSDDAINGLSKNYLNYRSLQKSKRSIKTIEQTIKNSRSIEKWLNDFEKIKELEHPAIIESPVSTIKPDRVPNEDLYSLISILHKDKDHVCNTTTTTTKLSESLTPKLNEFVLNLINLNSLDKIKQIEHETFNHVKKFVLPKSLANLDDINYLKWFLNDKNFTLLLEQPILSELSLNFILINTNLNIKLTNTADHSDSNLDDEYYLKYSYPKQNLILDSDKIKNILLKEKELSQSTNINNQGILESFREKYLQNENFKGCEILMNISKKNKHKKQNNCSNISSNSSTTTSSSCSSSNSNSSTPILTSCPNQMQKPDLGNSLTYSDLNDKLFLCFLSNFSCKLVENFLDNQNSTSLANNCAGFIRKHKIDKSFSYVNLINENDLKKINFKLYLKLNEWPLAYDFLTRSKLISSNEIKTYISKNTCLITLNTDLADYLETSLEEYDDEIDEEKGPKWIVDTRLVETIIFKCFNKTKLYLFYSIYFILNNLKHIVDGTSLMYKGSNDLKIDLKILLHHFLRYFDLTNNCDFEDNLNKFFINFSIFLRTNVISKFKTINRPNYFNLDLTIKSAEPSFKLDEFNGLLVRAENMFKNKAKNLDLNLQINFIKMNNNNEKLFNEYLIEFFHILFEQFKSKRDHFKINEQVLIDIHDRVIKSNENLNLILNEDIDISAALLSKFEMYAECVHKYLPQIRQHNQYLLFHYIWTMQVQYLAPFFNYICDLYKSYD